MSDDTFVVHPEGELDMASVAPLREQWLAASDRHRPVHFVIDLARVTFLDSTALAAVVRLTKRQREHGGDVTVVNASPNVVKVFTVTGMDLVVSVNGVRRSAGAPADP